MSKQKGGKEMQRQSDYANSSGVLQNHRQVRIMTKKENDDNPLFATGS